MVTLLTRVLRISPIWLLIGAAALFAFPWLVNWTQTAIWREAVVDEGGNKFVIEQEHVYRSWFAGIDKKFGEPLLSESTLTFLAPEGAPQAAWRGDHALMPTAVLKNQGTFYVIAKVAHSQHPLYSCYANIVFKWTGQTWSHVPESEVPFETHELNLVRFHPDAHFVPYSAIAKTVSGVQTASMSLREKSLRQAGGSESPWVYRRGKKTFSCLRN